MTKWTAAGPYVETDDTLAQDPGSHARAWKTFDTDDRGAIVSGRLIDYHGRRSVAYFRTQVSSKTTHRAELRLSTVDDLAVWLNGTLQAFVARSDAAWFDFLRNAVHKPQSVPLELHGGDNELVLRVRGGVYASGGFFAAVVD